MNFHEFRHTLEDVVKAPLRRSEKPVERLDVREAVFHEIPENVVVGLIRKHHPDTKITSRLVESCVSNAVSKTVTVDSAVYDLRRLNAADAIFDHHIDYKLEDGSVVVISENTQKNLNRLKRYPDIIAHMRESKDNFMDVVNQLED